MNKNCIILIILLLSSISNIQSLTFDLTNFIKKRYQTPLEPEEEHYFYAEAKKSQNVTFILFIDYTTNPSIQYLSINEYSDRSQNKSDIEKEITIISKSTGSGSLEFGSYIVSLPTTNYIAFKLITKKKISYFEAKIECTNGIYDLESGESKKIANIIPGGIYIFYIPAYELQKVNVSLSTISTNSKPFDSITAQEYEYRDNSFHCKSEAKIESISNIKSNSQLNSFFTYTVSLDKIYKFHQTNYLALKIIPNDISYLTIKIDNPIQYNDLENGIKKTFNNLKANTTYIFYCMGEKNQYAKIYLETTDSLNNKPFKNVIIYELLNKTFFYNYKREDVPFSFSTNNKQLSLSASYEIQSFYAHIISFRINPLYDIDSINIKINIQGLSYSLIPGISQKINNVISAEQYSFYLRTNLYDIININLTTNYIDSDPFTKLVVFESVEYATAYLINTSLSLNISKEGNQLVSVGSYRISNDCGYLLTLKTIPNLDINYIIAKMDIEKTFFTIYKNEKIKPINNLIAGIDYYVRMDYLPAEKKLNIILTMSYLDDIPFDYLYFSESYRKFEDIVKELNYKDIAIKKEGDKINATFAYEANDARYPYLFLKFTPKYNLTYFLPYIEYEEDDESDIDYDNDTYYEK